MKEECMCDQYNGFEDILKRGGNYRKKSLYDKEVNIWCCLFT